MAWQVGFYRMEDLGLFECVALTSKGAPIGFSHLEDGNTAPAVYPAEVVSGTYLGLQRPARVVKRTVKGTIVANNGTATFTRQSGDPLRNGTHTAVVTYASEEALPVEAVVK